MRASRCTVLVIALASAGLHVACSDGDSAGSPKADEDERGSVGVPPTAGEYCTKLGFALDGSNCKFPDGTICEQWSFYRGECGQKHTYCQKQGGSIASKTEDMGGWTAVYGVCTVNGKSCKESSFIQTGKCEKL
jgi:putative hemolysin